MDSFSQGSEIPAPSTIVILQNELHYEQNVIYLRDRSLPAKRIPEARHSKTLRRASPAPMGRFPVPIAFSQISSSGCKAGHGRNIMLFTNTLNKSQFTQSQSA